MSRPQITPFLAFERILDFAEDQLDPILRKEIAEIIDLDPDLKLKLTQVNRALSYMRSFDSLELLEPAYDPRKVVEKPPSAWKSFRDFSRANIKWYSLAVSIPIILSVSYVAYFKNKPQDSRYTALNKINNEKQQGQSEIINISRADKLESEPEKPREVSEASVVAATVAKNEIKPSPTPNPTATPAAVAVAAAKVETPKSNVAAETVAAAIGKGFLYRAKLRLPNMDKISAHVTETILQLKGERAGEVELGWVRKKAGSKRELYYHFSLPTDNDQELQERLKDLGALQIVKESHPRVMPANLVRYILVVEPDDE